MQKRCSLPVEEAMSAKLLEKGLGHLLTNVDGVKPCVVDLFNICDFDSGEVLHHHNFFRRVLWVGFWCSDVFETCEILAKAIAVL